MNAQTLFNDTATPHITEHLDAFVIVGYTADGHQKFQHVHKGSDPACADGLQMFSIAASRWLRNETPGDRPNNRNR